MDATLDIFKILAKMNVVPQRAKVAEMIEKLQEAKIQNEIDRYNQI